MRNFIRLVIRYATVVAAVIALTAIDSRIAHINSATAGFTYLLLVLGLAARCGLRESVLASIASMLAYNFFFLPPVGTFTISDPQNWVALFAFLATAITASQLSASARRKADEAEARRRELERTYEFSRALIVGDDEHSLGTQTVQHISSLFDLEDVWFYDAATDSIARSGEANSPLSDALLRETANNGDLWREAQRPALIVPIRLGGQRYGSLGVSSNTPLPETALQAIAQLVAIAIERGRVQALASRMEAARQNEQLKSTLLDAVAHEFKTPLTSIKASTTTILSRSTLDSLARELLNVVDEETDHLTSLVSDAIELARIGSGPVELHRKPCSFALLLSSGMDQLRISLEGREVETNLETGLPLMDADPKLSELALRQLLSNAVKYSPPWSKIGIRASEQGEFVVIEVSNAGSGIPPAEQESIFEKFYRGREARARIAGSGMGLAITREIVEAHGGRLWVESKPNEGACFYFSLPVLQSERLMSGRAAEN
jgi:two-component system, OmpR family, sensor histidine kinase KdpD